MTPRVADRLRNICLAFPDTEETETFGHPTFRVAGKTFCVLDEYKGQTAIAVKVGIAAQGIFLEDRRLYKTPYVGPHGWVSLRADSIGERAQIDWEEVRELVKGSYTLVATGPKGRKGKRAAKGK